MTAPTLTELLERASQHADASDEAARRAAAASSGWQAEAAHAWSQIMSSLALAEASVVTARIAAGELNAPPPPARFTEADVSQITGRLWNDLGLEGARARDQDAAVEIVERLLKPYTDEARSHSAAPSA